MSRFISEGRKSKWNMKILVSIPRDNVHGRSDGIRADVLFHGREELGATAVSILMRSVQFDLR